MSFGSLSRDAVEALNRGARAGRLPAEHRRGRRSRRTTATAATSSSRSARRTSAAATPHGHFDLARLKDLVAAAPVRAHRDQAVARAPSPGSAACCPAAKVTRRSPRSAASRPAGTAPHRAGTRCSATSTRCSTSSSWWPPRPGCRSASSRPSATWSSGTSWSADGWLRGPAAGRRLRQHRRRRGRHRRRAAGLRRLGRLPVPDRVQPRSTGASPRAGLTDDVAFIGGGKLGLTENAVVALRARRRHGATSAARRCSPIGCIQAQRCHTDRCPTGVATQNPWLLRGLDPDAEVGAGGQLRRAPAPRPAQGLRGGRRRATPA